MKQTIYEFLKNIPKGKVVSYKTIGECFGTSPRAIGKIMNSNKYPDIFPCYKVIRSDGDIGGYNGGTQEKIKKLSADGIIIINNKISPEYFRTSKDIKSKGEIK